MNLIDQIEQGIVHSEMRNLTQSYVDAGYISSDDQETLVNASWVMVTLALALYAKAAATPVN